MGYKRESTESEDTRLRGVVSDFECEGTNSIDAGSRGSDLSRGIALQLSNYKARCKQDPATLSMVSSVSSHTFMSNIRANSKVC